MTNNVTEPIEEQAEEVVETVDFVGYHFINWLIAEYGFDTAMIIKNIIIFFTGGIAFSLAFLFFLAYLGKQVKHMGEQTIDGVSVMRVKTKTEEHVYVSKSNSVSEGIESFFGLMIFFLTFKKIPILLRDTKRRKFFVWLTLTIIFVAMLFGILLTIRIVR